MSGRNKDQRAFGKIGSFLSYRFHCMMMRMTSAVCGRNKDQRGRNNQAVGADSFHHQSVETQTQTSITKYKIQIKIKHKSILVDFEKIPKLSDSIFRMDILRMTIVKHASELVFL